MDDTSSRRRTSLVWGGIAEVCLAGSLVAWLASPPAAGRAAFGQVGSLVVVAAAVVLTAAAAVATVVSAQTAWGLRWGIALPLAIAAGGVAVLALVALVGSRELSDAAVAVPLGVAVVGMNVVAAQVARRRLPDRDRR